MVSNSRTLVPASALAQASPARFPNESPEYRVARSALLAEEIELRRHIERVAAQRRALPLGGKVIKPYSFLGDDGLTGLVGLFRGKDTLAVYSFMFGPQRARPCPMCTALLGPLDRNAADIEQQIALAVVARSPLDRLRSYGVERGWRSLRLFEDTTGDYSRDYLALAPDGSESGLFNVFTQRDGIISHFWSDEIGTGTADPGEDPRAAPELAPLWNILDLTPRGRAPTWYPKLEYKP